MGIRELKSILEFEYSNVEHLEDRRDLRFLSSDGKRTSKELASYALYDVIISDYEDMISVETIKWNHMLFEHFRDWYFRKCSPFGDGEYLCKKTDSLLREWKEVPKEGTIAINLVAVKINGEWDFSPEPFTEYKEGTGFLYPDPESEFSSIYYVSKTQSTDW